MMLRFSVRSAVPVSSHVGRWLVDHGTSTSTRASTSTRTSHTTATLQAKNLLYRLVNKSKKKNWYETPPPKPNILNLPKKEYVESHRSKVLNSILFRAVSDLLTSAQLSYELQNLSPEITKVSLGRDFSSCRVFWKSLGDAHRDDLTQKALEKSASQIRDRRLAAIAEAQLAAIAAHKKQQIINKRKRKAPARDDDITPREFLLAQQAVATPRGRSQIRTKGGEEEEPEESSAFKEEEAGLRELASLEGKTTS
ncbi:hypothetical protein CRUP_017065, partial [Coryphaenoides rupestris]